MSEREGADSQPSVLKIKSILDEISGCGLLPAAPHLFLDYG